MIAWIITVWSNPLVRKITFYAAVTAAILYGLRLWGNRQWAKGEAQGRQYMARDLERRKQAEWTAKEAAIIADAEIVATEKRAVEADKARIAEERIMLARSLKDSLALIQRERNRYYENVVAAVPDHALWDAIRSISRELAAPEP